MPSWVVNHFLSEGLLSKAEASSPLSSGVALGKLHDNDMIGQIDISPSNLGGCTKESEF